MKNTKTVVILNQAAGYLQIDMLEAFLRKFNTRVIVAGTIVERGTSLPKDVKWHKTIKYNRKSLMKRVFTWLVATAQMIWIVAFRYRTAHIVAISNPPFSIYIPWLLKVKSYDIIVYDMYPDALANFGYSSRNSLLYKIWAKLNRKTFEKARRVFTLTKGMKELVFNYTSESSKIQVVPLWSDAADFKKVSAEDNVIRAKTDSLNKFCVVYSGNWGLTHPLETLISLAEYLDSEIFSIIIIGGGAKEKMLKETLETKKYPHVHLLPWQPIEMLAHSLHAADLSVITLDKEASNLSIPSKLYNIMSAGNPVLGICQNESGLAQLITQGDFGFVTDGQNLEDVAQKIKQLQLNVAEQKRFRHNSLGASKKFTKKNAFKYL